jgi:hypothetical protein
MRAAEWGSSSVIPPNSQAGSPSTGAPLSTDARALGVSTILSCVKALSDDTSTVPFYAFEGNPKGAHEPAAKQPRIVTEPFGPDLDPQSGMGQLVVSTAMRGNGYGFVVSRDKFTGLPDQLTIIHPDAVRPTREKGVKVFKIGHETYGTRARHRDDAARRGRRRRRRHRPADQARPRPTRSAVRRRRSSAPAAPRPASSRSPGRVTGRRPARSPTSGRPRTAAPPTPTSPPSCSAAPVEQLSVTPENAQFLETRDSCARRSAAGSTSPAADPGDHRQRLPGRRPGSTRSTPATSSTGSSRTATRSSGARPADPGGGETAPGRLRLRRVPPRRREDPRRHRPEAPRHRDPHDRRDPRRRGLGPAARRQGSDPFTPLNSNASPTGGADNQPARWPGRQS